MGIYAKSILFVRRLSVLGLFVGIFSVFFGGFYYRYMPANQAELDTRGFRILNQLEDNMVAKNKTVAEVLQNVGRCERCEVGDSNVIRQQIQAHLPFSIVSSDSLKSQVSFFPAICPCCNRRGIRDGPWSMA